MAVKDVSIPKDKKDLRSQAEGKQWPQVIAVFVVSLGCFSIGLNWSWSSPFSLVLTQDKVNYNITETETSYFLIFQPIGMLVCSPLYYKISEHLGTKKSLWMLGVPHLLGWIIAAFAKTKWEFYASRFLAGVADAVFFCSGPPYIGEVTTPTVRGYFAFMPIFSVSVGALAVTVLGSYLDVVTTSYINMVPSVIYLTLMYFLPESPYQLIRDNRHDDSRQSLKWFRRKSNVEEDFLYIKTAVEANSAERSSFKELFTVKKNRRALRAGMVVRCGQQFSGISIFTNYCQMIFLKAGGNFTPQMSSIIVLATSAALSLISSILIERFGRKPIFTISATLCGMILMSMSAYFLLDDYTLVDLKDLSWFPLFSLLAFIVVFSPGVGIVPTLMLGELFTGSIKYKSLCFLSGVFGIAVLLASAIFNLLNAYVGLCGPFLVYGICCFVTATLALRWVPETKGKTLEEIQHNFNKT